MMKQLVLDMGLAKGPSLTNFCVGPNAAAVDHLTLWLGQPGSGVRRSPVPTYLWDTNNALTVLGANSPGSGSVQVSLAWTSTGQQVQDRKSVV